MGYPIPVKREVPEAVLRRRMRGRGSLFGWRRRRAYEACVVMIERRERALGWSALDVCRTPPNYATVTAAPRWLADVCSGTEQHAVGDQRWRGSYGFMGPVMERVDS